MGMFTGKGTHIETDHKPLVPLLGTKHLDNRFDYTIKHVPSKEFYTADTLSRAPTGIPLTLPLNS